MKPAGRHTSFSPIDDRFDYSRKGIFFCRYNHESSYIRAFVLGIVLVVSLVLYLTSFPERGITGAAAFLIQTGVLAASPFLLIGGIRAIRSGVTYNYTANEEKMLIVCPRENYRADIFYDTVENITYEDIMYFSKLRGYHVTVYCTHGMYKFEFLFAYKVNPAFMKPENTPFRYIEERAGLINAPEYYAGARLDNPL